MGQASSRSGSGAGEIDHLLTGAKWGQPGLRPAASRGKRQSLAWLCRHLLPKLARGGRGAEGLGAPAGRHASRAALR